MMTSTKISNVLLSAKFQKRCYRGAIALFLLIVIIGSVPGARHDVAQYASGAVLHSAAYAVLGLLIFLGSSGNGSGRAVKAVLSVAVMGAVDEGVQSFFPYRTAALSDWMVDVAAAGIVSGVLREFWARLSSAAIAD